MLCICLPVLLCIDTSTAQMGLILVAEFAKDGVEVLLMQSWMVTYSCRVVTIDAEETCL